MPVTVRLFPFRFHPNPAPADWTSVFAAYALVLLAFPPILTGFAAFFIDFN
jgi:hypothetical protein